MAKQPQQKKSRNSAKVASIVESFKQGASLAKLVKQFRVSRSSIRTILVEAFRESLRGGKQ